MNKSKNTPVDFYNIYRTKLYLSQTFINFKINLLNANNSLQQKCQTSLTIWVFLKIFEWLESCIIVFIIKFDFQFKILAMEVNLVI